MSRQPVPEYDRLIASFASKAEAIVASVQRQAMAIFERGYSTENNADLDVNSELLALEATLASGLQHWKPSFVAQRRRWTNAIAKLWLDGWRRRTRFAWTCGSWRTFS